MQGVRVTEERRGQTVGRGLFAAAIGIGATLTLASARPVQRTVGPWTSTQQPAHWVVPQARSFSNTGPRQVIVERVHARIEIIGNVARTRLDIHVHNRGTRAAETALLIPVPSDSAVTTLDFSGGALEPTAELLPADEARRIYESIVATMRDPALLEFVGTASIRSSVFPVPAGGRQCMRIGYEQVLRDQGGTLEYILPRSESLLGEVPWSVQVDVRQTSGRVTLHSSSHDLALHPSRSRAGGGTRSSSPITLLKEPGAFRLSIMRKRADWSASMQLFASPEGPGGHFLMLAGMPEVDPGTQLMPRELTVVIDRSGSMAGGKLDQVRQAALQMIEGLGEHEAFNIIDYSTQIASFETQPVRSTRSAVLSARSYLQAMRPHGGTNIHGALSQALSQRPAQHGQLALPIVIFLTDGIPTIGERREDVIRSLASTQNTNGRRVFTFGVGGDVNAPLLDSIAEATGARASYSMPGQDVEVEIARLFDQLRGPVFTDVTLDVLDQHGQVDTRIWRDVYPAVIPDFYQGESLVLLGMYTAPRPMKLRMNGTFCGKPRSFTYDFDMAKSSTSNAVVPRLWASRKIAYLIDALRQAGAGEMSSSQVLADPRYAELAEEVVRLSTRYGVLSEYTSFLAREGTDLGNWGHLLTEANDNLRAGSIEPRSGDAAVWGSQNLWAGKQKALTNYMNRQIDSSGKQMEIAGVQQMADGAFLKRGQRWIESSLVGDEDANSAQFKPRVIHLGSIEHTLVMNDLMRQGRQGWLSLPGEILLRVKGEAVLIQNTDASR